MVDKPDLDSDAAGTSETILNAALAVLARDGFQKLTTRAIAEEAGVNHALISYYFGGKQKLLLAMLEAMESGKYTRQWDMYADPDVPLSQKWRRAVQFYRDDLADGYVRVAEELAQASHHDPEIARRWSAIETRWLALLAQAAADELPTLGIHAPPEYVASVVASFWRGMNTRIVEGRSEADGQFFEILEFVGDWLETREQSHAEE